MASIFGGVEPSALTAGPLPAVCHSVALTDARLSIGGVEFGPLGIAVSSASLLGLIFFELVH